MKNNRKGFSLFELLVVISIIGILVAVASVSFSSAQKKARDARRLEDMQSVAKAAETYYSLSNYAYPPSGASGTTWTLGGDTLLIFPTDPKNVNPYVYTYQRDVPVSGGFCACARVENTSSGNSAVNTCASFASSGNYYCVRNQQ